MHMNKLLNAAPSFSACLSSLSWSLGSGATMSSFSDRVYVRNEFQIGLLDLFVSYKNDSVTEYGPL